MASPAPTTRRTLFAIAAGAAMLPAFPTPAAAAVAAPSDPWEAFISALQVIHPDLAEAGTKARDRGYRPDELLVMMLPQNGEKPWMTFRHSVSQKDYFSFEDAN